MGGKGDVCQAELREKAMAAPFHCGLPVGATGEETLVGNST